jgi:methylenetetrahydrofolate reductase (NADPH)
MLSGNSLAKHAADGNAIGVSFEFFPPKTAKMEETLWDSIRRLAPLAPRFVSVTYGAGGSTRERTHATVVRLLRETAMIPAAHLTCVGALRDDIDDIVRGYWQAGVRHIVALRGDPVSGVGSSYQPFPGGYANAAELTAGIRAIGDFEISVAAYPEKHPESLTTEADIDMLQAKVDAGATRAITQMFFSNDVYFRYLERVRARGINIPVTPGLMPIHNFAMVSSFATKCGASVPPALAQRFAGLENDPETSRMVAAVVAAEQALDLAEQGVTNFHFYTANRANLVYAICHLLGLRPQPEQSNQSEARA